MRRGAEAEDPLLGAALLLVAARAPEGGVEAMMVERLLQPLGLPHIGVERAVVERVDPALDRLGVPVDEQRHPAFRRHPVAQRVHLAEFPRCIDVQQREGRGAREERLAREMQHHRAVLTDRIEHHGIVRLGHHLAHDVDRLGLEPLQVGEPLVIEQP